MLKLSGITKEYVAGDTMVKALKGIDLEFRKNEFVSVLGPSGCGKTTLLNIIGGLDRYTDGDLSINGVSTKQYRSADWDSYRNHSVGFVFQSYNLIPHQSVLSNVELALTLSGVSKSERRKRAKEVLEKVGLGDQIYKKPNQMSGGQMQRVAIARALVNDPEILLADEPTGALDTETSVQIMDLLKEISNDRLIIMVTHNPDLAHNYSNRIIELLDGKIISDSNPYDGKELKAAEVAKPVSKTSMSFFTALSLSFNNLLTKKARTFLTAFAGSIGIIGISLILSLSNGIQAYIDKVQEDTLSSYPISIQSETVDMSSLLETFSAADPSNKTHDLDKVYANTVMYDMMNAAMSIDIQKNNLTDFKSFLESREDIDDLVSDIQYNYSVQPNIYSGDTSDKITQINPSSIFDSFYGAASSEMMGSSAAIMSTSTNMAIWQEMLNNPALLQSQYEIVAGEWPDSFDEVVLVVDANNEIQDFYLFCLGIKDPAEIPEILSAAQKGETYAPTSTSFSYEDILNTSYKLVLPTDYYKYNTETDIWEDMRDNETYMSYIINNAPSIKIVGIIRPGQNATATSLTGAIGYTRDLTEYVINAVNASEIVKQQKLDTSKDIFNGLPFDDGTYVEPTDEEKGELVKNYFATLSTAEKAVLYSELAKTPAESTLNAMIEQRMTGMTRESIIAVMTPSIIEQTGMDEASISGYLAGMSDEEIFELMRSSMAEAIKAEYAASVEEQLKTMNTETLAAMLDGQLAAMNTAELAPVYDEYMPDSISDSTYEANLKLLGTADLASPSSINIYPQSFEAKESIEAIISEYNDRMNTEGKEENIISYTDYIGIILSSVSTIINVISYVLIAFVAISLIVSSIMIGIITYISVLERTKEIGVLRSIGASKKDVSRVFNAETLIVGLASGCIGILSTVLINIPANLIIEHLTDIAGLSKLPVNGAVILILISMTLTLVAGFIPSKIAAKKDPVVALRSE